MLVMAGPVISQASLHEPAQPAYVLRGHAAQIHAVLFLRANLRILTGDAEGWVVLWSTTTKRAVAVWRAHQNSILGFGAWDEDRIITHGRDNKIYVWQVPAVETESQFSTTLPIDDPTSERKQPWLLHTLDVNALNFCSFAMCQDLLSNETSGTSTRLLIATPGLEDGQINVTSLPDEARVATLPSPKDAKTGMVMALGLHFQPSTTADGSPTLFVAAGFESGHVGVWRGEITASSSSTPTGATWSLPYLQAAHTQPVLSLCISTTQGAVYTSSADAILARHTLPTKADSSQTRAAAKSVQTKHAGQQSICVRSDARILATAGWDGRARVYSAKTMKELAVLKWHREGCYALAFAAVLESNTTVDNTTLETQIEEQAVMIASPSNASQNSVAARREHKAQNTHWLALGSKDGRVSLWEIY